MRVNRRLAVYSGLVLLVLGGRQSVLAQSNPGVYQMNPGNPPPNFTGPGAPATAPSTYNASMATPEYSSSYPSVIPVVPPPLPPNAYGSQINPYPTISPY